MFLGRHFGNKARVVLIAVDLAHQILPDDLRHGGEDPAARCKNIRRALAPAGKVSHFSIHRSGVHDDHVLTVGHAAQVDGIIQIAVSIS